MASFFAPLSKPQLLKRIFCNNFPKPLYHFSSSANELNPDPNPHHLTHESQPDPHKTDHYKKVEALCKDQRLNDAKQLIYSLAQKGIHKNEDLFILLINGYANTAPIYVAYENALRIFKKMDKLGVSKTVKSYNHLFHVLLSAKMCARASMFFDKMFDERVGPDMDTYRIMIPGLCGCYSVHDADIVFQHMKRRKFLPDIVMYNSMINGYARFNEMDEAEKIIVEMKGGNIEPDLVTYNAMVNGYAQVRKMEDVERLVVEMNGRNIEPDLVTYNAMIDGYFLAEKMEDAEKLFRDMKERGVEADVFTYATMIKGYVKAERVDNGLELLEEMKGKRFGRNVDAHSFLGLLIEDRDSYPENMWRSLRRLKEDCDAENMSKSQRSVLQGVKDYVKGLELLPRDAATE